MNVYLTYNLVIIAFLLLFNFGIIGLVLLSSARNKSNRLFALAVLLLTLYKLFSHLSDLPLSHSTLYVLIKIDFVFGMWGAYVYLAFVIQRTNYNLKPRIAKVMNGLFVITGVFSFLSLFSDLLVKRIIVTPYGADPISGVVDYLFVMLIIAELSFALTLLFNRYRLVEKYDQDRELKYITIGTAYIVVSVVLFLLLTRVFISSGLFTLSPFVRTVFMQLDDIGVIIFVGVTGYGILRHQLFGIRMLLGKLVFWLNIALLGLVISYSIALMEKALLASAVSATAIIVNIFIAIFIAFILAIMEVKWRRAIKIWVNKLAFDEEELFELIENDLRRCHSEEMRLEILSEYLVKLVQPEKLGLVSLSEEFGMITFCMNFSKSDMEILSFEDSINKLLSETRCLIIQTTDDRINQSILLIMKALNVELILMSHSKNVILLLGGIKNCKHIDTDVLIRLLDLVALDN